MTIEAAAWTIIGVLSLLAGVGAISCLVVLARAPYKK